jgi:protoporphyrinogen oxidase
MGRRIAVIGAGPAGLAAAVRVVDQGGECVLLEAGSEPGGLARTIEVEGRPVDVGPHVFFGGLPAAVEMWTRFLGPSHEVPLRRGILRNGAILEHPPQPRDLLRELSMSELVTCGLGLVSARLKSNRHGDDDAESWIVSRYGQPLFDIIARPYIEKLWGRPGTDLHASFARGLFGGADEVKSVRAASGSAATFRFPVGGTSSVWARMADAIRGRGTIRFNAPVTRMAGDGGGYVVTAGGVDERCDAVVSTLPLPRLAAALGAPPGIQQTAASLVTRHILMAHFPVDGGRSLDRAWIFVPDRKLAVGRVSDGRAWTGRPPDGVVAMEFWCGDADPIWNLDAAAAVAHARRELQETGLISGRIGTGRITRLPRALPVPMRDAPAMLAAIREFLGGIEGLHLAGRHGSFSFNSMSDAMAEGIGAADRALAG